MKYFLSLTLLLIWFLSPAQGTYYNTLNDSLRCQQLKTALKKLISTGYIERSYNDVKGFMESNDRKKNDAGTFDIIWDMYSDNPSGPEPYEFRINTFCSNDNTSTEGVCWNREHSLPASWFNNAAPTFTDIVNLVPADALVNNRKSNNPFGKVGSATFTSQNGSKLGSSSTSGISGTVFEPIDAYKGDFARIMLYMITRYEDSLSKWGGADAARVLSPDVFLGYKREYLNLLLQWHEQDPPSQKERDRNNATQIFQGNRNPFVDRPEFAKRIWNTSPEDCARFTVNVFERVYADISLFPNPVINSYLYMSGMNYTGARYMIFDISGRSVASGILQQTAIPVEMLEKGSYILIIEDGDLVARGRFIKQ